MKYSIEPHRHSAALLAGSKSRLAIAIVLVVAVVPVIIYNLRRAGEYEAFR